MPHADDDHDARRAFVAGATGYTGQAVVQHLRTLGVDTTAHVRPDSARLDAWRNTFEAQGATVSSAAWTVDAMRKAFATLRPSEVYCLIGTTSARAKRSNPGEKDAYEAVDYGLTKCLLDAAVAAGLTPRFVYLSSLGANADSRMAYLRARGRAEDAVTSSGLPFTIVRPSFISGSDRAESRPGERVGAAVTNGALAVLGALGARRLRNRYRSVTAATLAKRLVDAAADPSMDGETRTMDAFER